MADNYKIGTEITVDSKQAEVKLKDYQESVEAVDKATQDADKSTASFSEGLQSLGKGVREFGQNFSLYVTAPIAAFAGLAVREFLNAENELNKLNIALKNSGRFTQQAVKEFKALADELERTTTFSGGEAMTASALALNFARTTEEAQRLVKVAADLSAVTGDDLSSSVRNLGMSLNGMAMPLSRVAPELRDASEEFLKAGGAIDYLEDKFRGSAVIAAQTLTGQITQLRNAFNGFLTTIGSEIAPYLQAFVARLNDLVSWLNSLDAQTRRYIIVIGAMAAAIGPVLVGIGLLVSSIGVAMGGLTAMIGFISSTAIGTLGFFGSALGILSTILTGVGTGLLALLNPMKLFNTALLVIDLSVTKLRAGFMAFFRSVAAGAKSVLAFLVGPAGIALAVIAIVTTVAGLINTFVKLRQAGVSTGEALGKIFKLIGATIVNALTQPLLKLLELTFYVYEQVNSFLGFDTLAGVATRAKQQIQAWSSSVGGMFTDTVSDINGELDKVGSSLGTTMTFGLNNQIAGIKDSFANMFGGMGDDLKELFEVPVVNGFDRVNAIGVEIAKDQEKTTKTLTEKQNQYAQTISSSFGDAFSTISQGTKSVSEAFSDMAGSIIQDLSRMIIQQAIYNAISGFFGGGGGSSTQMPASNFNPAFVAATGGFVNKGNLTHRYAAGGLVSGPGTGTSDSIPARLSNGEFVSDARTVSHFGPDFFLNLKHMARSFSMPSPILNRTPAFANGGLVGGAGSGEMRVTIQNSGSPKEASSVTTEQDAQGMVVNIILEDIQRNGNISKSFQTNYGLKRGGI